VSKEAQRQFLTSRMDARLGDFSFPISMPNQPFDIPRNAVYGEFHILSNPKPLVVGGEGRGKVRVRHVGFVQLNVWIPKNKGTKPSTEAEDIFEDIWQFWQGRDLADSSYKFGPIEPFTPQTKKGWECRPR